MIFPKRKRGVLYPFRINFTNNLRQVLELRSHIYAGLIRLLRFFFFLFFFFLRNPCSRKVSRYREEKKDKEKRRNLRGKIILLANKNGAYPGILPALSTLFLRLSLLLRSFESGKKGGEEIYERNIPRIYSN